ncbi:phosphatase PAP2 family protein [Streptomonospora wellingtoniae]|uniref:Phosphatase PAP2 family protein n=1 Tax=Streptomonospora wellingtoniae TaxID=3075544 RepID=A0ABU2KPQ8_9ACTN|nr:phosphatase PAP2 family protein [Streptomonospora sp. DSM 45055]MDT0301118.1 phosphatase PAP2 family protein [Streptomonospora sp. DSM 45055]
MVAIREVCMDAVWDVEIVVVEWIQSWGRWLEAPMEAVTLLGSQALLLVLVPLVFWSLHPAVGARLYLIAAGAALVADLLKIALHGARPSWFHLSVRPLAGETTFGAPSAHAATSLVLWGYGALRLRRRGAWWAAAAIVAAVGLTRIYLGAHFVTDVLAGWLLGAAALWAALRYEDALLARWRRLGLPAQTGLALAASLAPLLAAAGWQALFHADWTPPEEWTGSVPPGIGDASLEHTAGVAGGLFGGVLGLSALAVRGWYSAAGSAVSRAARYVVGISGTVLILAVADVAVPGAAGSAGLLREYLVFAVLGAWSALGAPELFLRMGLAGRPGGVGRAAGAGHADAPPDGPAADRE